jgi:hypothetical protein
MTHVIERLTVPCWGIGSIGLVVEQPASPITISRNPSLRTSDTVARRGYGRTGLDGKRDALPGLRLSA